LVFSFASLLPLNLIQEAPAKELMDYTPKLHTDKKQESLLGHGEDKES